MSYSTLPEDYLDESRLSDDDESRETVFVSLKAFMNRFFWIDRNPVRQSKNRRADEGVLDCV